MHITVVALGKIGLPLAAYFAGRGHRVTGVDIAADTVELVNAGKEPFPGETGLAELLAETVADGRLRATTDYGDAVPGSDAVVVVVPLFVDERTGEPRFDSMDAATRSIAEHLTPGTLVSYETTLPVGTTRNRLRPMIEQVSGLTEGEDFHVAFSPERVLTGRVFADLRKYPKLVGALSESGTKHATAFYSEVLDASVWDLGSAEAAEFAKLAETTYRDVNIALANQFARFASAHGIDVYQVIEASNSQPYSHIHRPGIAVGGHCIPVYPRLYLWTDPEATVVEAAREANLQMPAYTVGLLREAYGELAGARVAVLGAAYRGGVKETAFSGVFPVAEELRQHGAHVLVHDPLYTDLELARLGFTPYRLGGWVDAAIVQADHSAYARLTPDDLPGVRVLVDGRDITDPIRWSSGDAARIVLGRPA